MPNENRRQNDPSFISKAAVGILIGAGAAVAGYFFGKAQEEAKHEARAQQHHAHASHHYPHSTHGPSSSAATGGDDLKKKPDGDARECGICFRDLEEVKRNDEAIHTTPCGHVYCNECLQESLRRNPVCPSCRSRVLPDQTLRIYL